MLNRWDAHLWPPLRYGSAISRSLVTFECRSRCSGRSMTRVTRSIRSPISRGPGRGSPSEGVEQLHTELRDELALRQQMGDLCWRLGRASQAFRHSLDRFDHLSLIHISEPTRRTPISYAVFCLKKKKKKNQ